MSMRITLKPDERVIYTLRRYFPSYFWQLVGICALIAVPFFFMFKLFQWQPWGIYVFGAPLAAALLCASRLIFLWRANVFLVTSERLIDIERRGIFHRELHEISWHKVQSIGSETKGMWATLFKVGVVKIETHGVEYDFESHLLKHPDAVQLDLSHILETFERAREHSAGSYSMASLLDHLALLNAEDLDRVQHALDVRRKNIRSSDM